MSLRLQYSVDVRRAGWALALVAALLATTHVVVMLLYFNGVISRDDWWHFAFFDLDEEEGFGTWFSSMILLVTAQVLFIQSKASRAAGDPWYRWWLVLCIGFLFLSVDEVVGIHEYINTIVESTRWTTFGMLIVGVVGLAYLPFLMHLPRYTRFLFIVAGVLYVAGAVGVERLTDWYLDEDLLNTLAYNLWTAVEETLEMAGVIIFISALLAHMSEPQWDAA
jgi:hypothetical protein